MIVTGGMLVASIVLLVLFFIAVHNLPTALGVVIIATYVIAVPIGIYMIVKIYKERKRVKI